MKLFNAVLAAMQQYYLTRDDDNLKKALNLVAAEIEQPELQKARITVPIGLEALEQTINAKGFLQMQLAEADSDGPVLADKSIRVFSAEQEDECMILTVAHIDVAQIILVPSGV